MSYVLVLVICMFVCMYVCFIMHSVNVRAYVCVYPCTCVSFFFFFIHCACILLLSFLHTFVCVFQWYRYVCIIAFFLVYEPQAVAVAAAPVHWPACWVTVQINGKIIKSEAKSMEMCMIKTNVRVTYRTWHQFTYWTPAAEFKATMFPLERGYRHSQHHL